MKILLTATKDTLKTGNGKTLSNTSNSRNVVGNLLVILETKHGLRKFRCNQVHYGYKPMVLDKNWNWQYQFDVAFEGVIEDGYITGFTMFRLEIVELIVIDLDQ